MATKFSAFNPIGPSATTECVGLDGATNVRYAIGDIDVSNLTGFPLLINQGGTGTATEVCNLLNAIFASSGTPTAEVPVITSNLVIKTIIDDLRKY